MSPIKRDSEMGFEDREIMSFTITTEADPLPVTWDGADDSENPKNWPLWRKWLTTIFTSLGGLVTLMSGVMMAPALSAIRKDLHAGDSETSLALSIFVLAYAFGPLVLAPSSEVFGRKPVWLLASSWYVLWNMSCGFAQNKGWMIAGRFLAGLGASAEFAITLPVLSDCWRAEERGHSFAIATFIPLLGPAIGPILGGFISQGAGWRWLFWVLSIFDGLLVLLVLMFFRETHAPTILARRSRRLRKATGRNYRTEHELASPPTLSCRLKLGLSRPYRLMITQPILQLMSLYFAYNFGVLYIVLSTFANIWIDQYDESVNISGLHYLGLVIGYTIAAQVGGRLTDRLWDHLKKKRGGVTAPEFRVLLMVPGAALLPAGLLLYGWSAEYRVQWALTDVGAAIFGCGTILVGQAMQAYVIEAFLDYTASAITAAQFPRNIFAFVFPIFAPSMYRSLGYGWSNSLLAFLFLVVVFPAPLILWKSGARLREKGKKEQR